MLSGKRKYDSSSSHCDEWTGAFVAESALEKRSRLSPYEQSYSSAYCATAGAGHSNAYSSANAINGMRQQYDRHEISSSTHVTNFNYRSSSSSSSSNRHDIIRSSGYEGRGEGCSDSRASSSSSSSSSLSGKFYLSHVMNRAVSSLYSASYASYTTKTPDSTDTAASDGTGYGMAVIKRAPYQNNRRDTFKAAIYDDKYDDYDSHKCHVEKKGLFIDPFSVLSDAYLSFDDICIGSEGDGKMLRKYIAYAIATFAMVVKVLGFCDLLNGSSFAAWIAAICVCGGYSVLYLMKVVVI